MRTPDNIQVHEFEDSGDAYDMSQCSDDIEMGDILVIKSEQVVGFLLSAWPVAVTVEHGKLHAFATPTPDLLDKEDNKLLDGQPPRPQRDWTPFFEKAKAVALELGFTIFDGTNRVSAPETTKWAAYSDNKESLATLGFPPWYVLVFEGPNDERVALEMGREGLPAADVYVRKALPGEETTKGAEFDEDYDRLEGWTQPGY